MFEENAQKFTIPKTTVAGSLAVEKYNMELPEEFEWSDMETETVELAYYTEDGSFVIIATAMGSINVEDTTLEEVEKILADELGQLHEAEALSGEISFIEVDGYPAYQYRARWKLDSVEYDFLIVEVQADKLYSFSIMDRNGIYIDPFIEKIPYLNIPARTAEYAEEMMQYGVSLPREFSLYDTEECEYYCQTSGGSFAFLVARSPDSVPQQVDENWMHQFLGDWGEEDEGITKKYFEERKILDWPAAVYRATGKTVDFLICTVRCDENSYIFVFCDKEGKWMPTFEERLQKITVPDKYERVLSRHGLDLKLPEKFQENTSEQDETYETIDGAKVVILNMGDRSDFEGITMEDFREIMEELMVSEIGEVEEIYLREEVMDGYQTFQYCVKDNISNSKRRFTMIIAEEVYLIYSYDFFGKWDEELEEMASTIRVRD